MSREVSFEEDVIDRLARIEENVKSYASHGERIDSLERSRDRAHGLTVVLGAVAGLAAPFLKSKLGL